MRPYYASGTWQKGAIGCAVRNPWSGEEIDLVSVADERSIQDALIAAEKAFAQSRIQSPQTRSKVLSKIAQAIHSRAEEFANTIVWEAGKPIRLAKMEVARAISTFEVAAKEALIPFEEEIHLVTTPSAGTATYHALLQRFPIGTILGITPFNFPLNLVAHKVAPVIASGNCILIKPSPRTPLSALLLAEVLETSDVFSGQVSIIPFDHSLVKDVLKDSRIRMLSFTGSAEVGWDLKTSLPVRSKVALELGGNATVIVEADAHWEEAIPAIATSAFGYAGQSCISTQRILVHESIYAPFREKLLSYIKNSLSPGNPQLPETSVGPLIDPAARKRILDWIEKACTKGAVPLTPIVSWGLSVLEPVLLEKVPENSPLECQEVFGPVATLRPYSKVSEAFAQVNSSDYGLQASIFTQNPKVAQQAFDILEVGAVLINEIPSFRADNMPYGGIKASGWGREGIRYSMWDMTEPKLRVERL